MNNTLSQKLSAGADFSPAELTGGMVDHADLPFRDWLLYALEKNPPGSDGWQKLREVWQKLHEAGEKQ